jgi:hypothetical protein
MAQILSFQQSLLLAAAVVARAMTTLAQMEEMVVLGVVLVGETAELP